MTEDINHLKQLLGDAIARNDPSSVIIANALSRALERDAQGVVINEESLYTTKNLVGGLIALGMFVVAPFLAIAQQHVDGYKWPISTLAATTSLPQTQCGIYGECKPLESLRSLTTPVGDTYDIATLNSNNSTNNIVINVIYDEAKVEELPKDVVPQGGTVEEAERVVADASGAKALIDVSKRLELDPVQFVALMSWESGGTLNPNVKGGDDNLYEGLIQFSPENAKRYGAEGTNTIAEQAPAIEKYLLARGFKPGEHDIRHAYAAVLVGTADENYVDEQGRLAWDIPDSNKTTVRNAYPKFTEGSHYERAKNFLNNSGVVEIEVTEVVEEPPAPEPIVEEVPTDVVEPPKESIEFDMTELKVGDVIGVGRITSLQDPNRKHPVTGIVQPHRGVDWAGKPEGGEKIYAPGDVNVICKDDPNGGGHYAEWQFADMTWQVLHLVQDSCVEGNVEKGQVIGLVGNTGIGTGSHADIRIRGIEDRSHFYSVRKGHIEAVVTPDWNTIK